MRIAFVGKGGSGKTTLASLFARTLAAGGKPVICIDADINQHLGEALGLSAAESASLPPLGNEIRAIKEHLRGSNPLIASADLMAKTTPPGAGSRLLRFSSAEASRDRANDPIFERFAQKISSIPDPGAGSLVLMATGPFAEEDLGVSCYHSKTGAAELLLNHLIDGPGEYVIADMTAGADSFASGLFSKFDLTAVAVEPTLKSISVFRQYKQYCEGFDIALCAVGNKIAGAEDAEFLRRELGDELAAAVSSSLYVRAAERGAIAPINQLEAENRSALGTLRALLDSQAKDWDKLLSQAWFFHQKNCASWANAAYGADLTTQIDHSFSYEKLPSEVPEA